VELVDSVEVELVDSVEVELVDSVVFLHFIGQLLLLQILLI